MRRSQISDRGFNGTMESELLVIGGGPAGCSFAARAAKGAQVTVLEEHPQIGRPVQCTGLVAPRVVDLARAKGSVLCAIRGARFHFPAGTVIDFRSSDIKALVVDRQGFDQRCAENAADAGAKILTNSRFTRAAIRPDGVEARFLIEGRSEKCLASLIVGADGYKSRVSEIADLPQARERIKGLQVDLDVKERGDVLDVYIGSKVAPGFFAWRIPCGDFVRVGVCISPGNGAPSHYLRSLLKRLELDDARILERNSGVIPLGFPPRTYADRTLLVGDAAGQAKPLSGGGLYTGITAAGIAADVALAAREEGDLSADRLSEYQRTWKEEIGRTWLPDPQGLPEAERSEARGAGQNAGPTGGQGGPVDRGHRFPQPAGAADDQGRAQAPQVRPAGVAFHVLTHPDEPGLSGVMENENGEGGKGTGRERQAGIGQAQRRQS
jgi:digeranylgeranylglycerophospholipid reductase